MSKILYPPIHENEVFYYLHIGWDVASIYRNLTEKDIVQDASTDWQSLRNNYYHYITDDYDPHSPHSSLTLGSYYPNSHEEAMKVDTDMPLLFVETTFGRDMDKVWLLIDGVHRGYKMVMEKRETIPILAVVQEFSDKYLI